MLDFLNEHTVANDVRMRGIGFKGAFLLVEGRSDQKLYIKFTAPSETQVLICRTRVEVFAAVQILNADHFGRVAGITDADFDRLEDRPPPAHNVFFTDGHDAEMMMFDCAEATQALLSEFTSPDKLDTWRNAHPLPLLDQLRIEASKIGALRLHSHRANANLDFGSFKNGLRFSDFVKHPEVVVEVDALIQHVLNKSGRPHAVPDPIRTSVESILASNYSLVDLCRGHDLVDLLSFALRKSVGSCAQIEATGEIIESHLRVAYSNRCFQGTSLYGVIRGWEMQNAPLRILGGVNPVISVPPSAQTALRQDEKP